MDEVELRQLVQVEDPRGEACDQDVRRFVEGSSAQVVKVSIFVEKVSERVNMGQMVLRLVPAWSAGAPYLLISL